MRRSVNMALAPCVLLGACGGGGTNSAGSVPIAVTPTPAPTNTVITDLKASQIFSANGASVDTSINLSDRLVEKAASTTSTVKVSYDAVAKSYTIETAGRSAIFTAAQGQKTEFPGETRYTNSDSAQRDYLTIATQPYNGSKSNAYVALGYWQRNSVSSTTQNTVFDAFVFGLETAATAVPRTGYAGYETAAFGFITTPGKEPKAFTGAGTLDVDLSSGTFRSINMVGEYSLASNSYGSGGGIELVTTGQVGSGNSLSGNVYYAGFDGVVSGTMNGRFFGPSAEEVGASFSATNRSGAAVTGTLTGQRDTTRAPVSLTLTNIVAATSLPAPTATWTTATNTSLSPQFRGAIGYNGLPNGFSAPGNLQLTPDGGFAYRPYDGMVSPYLFGPANRSATQRPNFASYDFTTDGNASHVDIYRPAMTSSGEIQLTYAGFGIWSVPFRNGSFAEVRKFFAAYGFETPVKLLAGRTGTASYDGIVYGSTATTSGETIDVGGTSRFAVDFSNQRYEGALMLTGVPTGGGTTTSLGTWTFSDAITARGMNAAALNRAGATTAVNIDFSNIAPRFYGPDAQEIAATFTILNNGNFPADIGSTAISGVTVAKRR